ncbi:hypothetical protein [Paenibacillus mesophilus]|uniref:hypothetical protein n=1 Tax=Paenibacillus mesophilus TaxID=2582849 RepID=UPI0013050E32|nr:hypothetical protein [Paenibacillus mesophilus]
MAAEEKKSAEIELTEEQNLIEVEDLPEELSNDQMNEVHGGWGGARNYLRPKVRGA